MSKERLGFDVNREKKHLKKIVDKDDSLTISSRFVKYLIEQAERVEWLVENRKLLEDELHEARETGARIYEQNKRYRELLTSQTLKRLIRLESKGNFLPENWRNDYDNFKLEIEKMEESN